MSSGKRPTHIISPHSPGFFGILASTTIPAGILPPEFGPKKGIQSEVWESLPPSLSPWGHRKATPQRAHAFRKPSENHSVDAPSLTFVLAFANFQIAFISSFPS